MFKKFHKFTAFTLAEILIVFSIIAIISGLTLMTTKRLQTTDKYAYQKAYDSLLTAAYNAVAEVNSKGIGTPELLCEGLTKYINSQAAEKPKDSNKFTGHPDQGFCNDIADEDRPGIDASDFEEVRDANGNLIGGIPDFIANNGMRFYISDLIETGDITDSLDMTQRIRFYIVYVDLDGVNGQNSIENGDVVAFAITENADVIPLGKPAYDTHYLGVRVVFPESTDRPDETYSESMTYYDAIHTAWGGNLNFDDMRTVDFNTLAILRNGGAKFLDGVVEPDAPNQHNFCICDSAADKPEIEDNECYKPDNSKYPQIQDRFDCDIKIQRYY